MAVGDSLDGFAAVLNARVMRETMIARVQSFCWLCGGAAIAAILIGVGIAVAFYGFSFIISPIPASNQAAEALAQVLRKAEIKTLVSGSMTLAEDAQLKLVPGQAVKLNEGATVKLDPGSSVRILGDLKVDVPQPSKRQLQLDAVSQTKELPFTRYTVFKSAGYGQGEVVTGWNFDLADTTRPVSQRCYYSQPIDKGMSASQTLGFNGVPRPPSSLTKLTFDFDGAFANCIWFSGI